MVYGVNEANAQRVCKNLLKFNETDLAVYITLDVDRSGLELNYQNICYIMKRFYDKLMFYADTVDVRKFKKCRLDEHIIILERW